MPTLATSIQHSLGKAIRQEEIKDIQIRKEEIKLPLFEDEMIIYVKHNKDSTTQKTLGTDK